MILNNRIIRKRLTPILYRSKSYDLDSRVDRAWSYRVDNSPQSAIWINLGAYRP